MKTDKAGIELANEANESRLLKEVIGIAG